MTTIPNYDSAKKQTSQVDTKWFTGGFSPTVSKFIITREASPATPRSQLKVDKLRIELSDEEKDTECSSPHQVVRELATEGEQQKGSSHTSHHAAHEMGHAGKAWKPHGADQPEVAPVAQWASDTANNMTSCLEAVDVVKWLASVDDDQKKDTTSPLSPELQKLDPSTGQTVNAFQYPDTHIAPEDPGNPSMAWNKRYMTSALQMYQDHRVQNEHPVVSNPAEEPATNHLEMVHIPEEEWPWTDCVVRPASEEHFQQMMEIISLEAHQKHCPQVLESKEVQERDLRRMLDVCRNNLRPFVVACLEEEDFHDRSKWPVGSGKQYMEYVKFKAAQPVKPPVVVGFAFVTEPRIGLLNSPCPGSRFAGQIKILVHPEHGNRLYGSALLDRILRCVAPYHRSLVDYDWKCDNPGMIYDESSAALNRRQYAQVIIENITSAGDADPRRILKEHMLEKFDFKKIGCLHDAVRTDRGPESEWLDLELWQLKTHATIVDDSPNAYLSRQ